MAAVAIAIPGQGLVLLAVVAMAIPAQVVLLVVKLVVVHVVARLHLTPELISRIISIQF